MKRLITVILAACMSVAMAGANAGTMKTSETAGQDGMQKTGMHKTGMKKTHHKKHAARKVHMAKSEMRK